MKKKEEKAVEVKLSDEQKSTRQYAISLHSRRIDNLKAEFSRLSLELEKVELDSTSPRQLREKNSDTLIRRMTIIEYEIKIREGLIRWLS
jgi:hypothetical protein